MLLGKAKMRTVMDVAEGVVKKQRLDMAVT